MKLSEDMRQGVWAVVALAVSLPVTIFLCLWVWTWMIEAGWAWYWRVPALMFAAPFAYGIGQLAGILLLLPMEFVRLAVRSYREARGPK